MQSESQVSRAEFEALKAELVELKLLRAQKALRAFKRNKRLAVGILATLIVIPVSLYALSITKSFNFTAGNPAVASEVNTNFDQLFTKVNDLAAFHPPIGAIIAWHKSMAGTPQPLPLEWVECNGQMLTDPQSPYNTKVIPNLNNSPPNPAGGTYPAGYFLRGGTTSGVIQDDRFQGHYHSPFTSTNHFLIDGSGFGESPGNSSLAQTQSTTGSPVTDTTNGTPRIANETRPINMSVVWIMKVK